jgi:hypothetical protein
MTSLVVNVTDRADLHSAELEGTTIPGVGIAAPARRSTALGTTRFMGDPESGPWVYFLEKPTGTEIPMHRHKANRIEFVLEGSILWKEKGEEPKEYGANTLTYVRAGTVYGYTVLADTKILVVFEEPPGVQWM